VGALETVISVGEACSAKVVERWSGGERRFLNGYGPTETTIGATVGECEAGRAPTIGRPLRNMEVYILDEQQQLQPIGVGGEIYVGGIGLARGYLQRPGLTAERFLPHPYSERVGARLYRTGDRGRYLSNGEIEYLGRLDQQVKVRGYRIELGEIEAALQQHPLVQQATVSCREDEAGEKRLVAYLVGTGEAGLSAGEARAFLKERVPDYMIPSSFVSLEALPLTVHGKVDRKALPAPESLQLAAETQVGPRTELEEILVTIWQEVLHNEQVGVHDNFFDLGGHSLLIAKVHSLVQDALQINFPMVRLFEYPTISSLAEFLNGSVNEAPIVSADTRGATRRDLLEQQRNLRQTRRLAAAGSGAEHA